MYLEVNDSQVDLLRRAVGRWQTAVDENEIWSASDEEGAKEALYLLNQSLNDLYSLLDPEDLG